MRTSLSISDKGATCDANASGTAGVGAFVRLKSATDLACANKNLHEPRLPLILGATVHAAGVQSMPAGGLQVMAIAAAAALVGGRATVTVVPCLCPTRSLGRFAITKGRARRPFQLLKRRLKTMNPKAAKSLRIAPLETPTDLASHAIRDIPVALTTLLADMFALYDKKLPLARVGSALPRLSPPFWTNRASHD
jgi:hypothetical protein